MRAASIASVNIQIRSDIRAVLSHSQLLTTIAVESNINLSFSLEQLILLSQIERRKVNIGIARISLHHRSTGERACEHE